MRDDETELVYSYIRIFNAYTYGRKQIARVIVTERNCGIARNYEHWL